MASPPVVPPLTPPAPPPVRPTGGLGPPQRAKLDELNKTQVSALTPPGPGIQASTSPNDPGEYGGGRQQLPMGGPGGPAPPTVKPPAPGQWHSSAPKGQERQDDVGAHWLAARKARLQAAAPRPLGPPGGERVPPITGGPSGIMTPMPPAPPVAPGAPPPAGGLGPPPSSPWRTTNW